MVAITSLYLIADEGTHTRHKELPIASNYLKHCIIVFLRTLNTFTYT